MAFHDLQSKLGPLASPGPGPLAPLLLNAALIESDLLDALLQIGAISIDDPRVAVGEGCIVVSGKASFLGVAEPMQVEAVFEDDGGQIRFRLTASLPDIWTFGQSFPTLPPNFNFDPSPGSYGYGDSYLSALRFSKPAFVLTTHPCRDPEFPVEFERGLNFRGQMELDPSGPLKGLDLLTGSKNAPVISGLIASSRAAPEFFLSARMPLHGGDNPLLKMLQNFRLKLWCSLAAENTAAARIEVSVELELLKGRTVELYCPFRIGAPLNFLVIGSRFTGFALPDLGDIADLVGGKDLKEKIPEAVRSLGGLTIKEVRIGVSLTGPEVAWVLVSVHTTSPWKIIPSIFEIDALFVTWLIESPFKSDQRRISCELEGRLGIAGVAADIYAQFPDFRVSGALSEGSTIELGKLLKHFIPAIPLPDDSLIISTLALLIDPKSETYQIDAQVDNVWSLPLGSGQLAIQSLSLSLAKTPEGTSGSLAGVMELPLPKAESGAGRELTLNLSADLPGASAEGWQFRGSTGDGQDVPIGVLIKMLVNMLGEVALPAPLEKFAIRNLSVSFNTGSKHFTFTCEGRLPLIDGKPVEAKVEIDIDQQRVTRKFHGQLSIPTAGQPLNFTMKFEEDAKVQMFVATYHEAGGRQISIDGLLEKVLSQPVTTGLQLTVNAAYFAFRGDAGPAGYLFGVDLGAEIELSRLPVVGGALPKDQRIGLESLRVIAASAPFSRQSVEGLNRLLPAGIKPLGGGSRSGDEGNALEKGFTVSAALMFGKTPYTLALPVAAGGKQAVAAPGSGTATAIPEGLSPASPAVADTATKWFEIDKSLGPFSLRRIGLGYEEGRVGVKFDAGLQLNILTFSLEGLGLSYPLDKFTNPAEFLDHVEFSLDGIELSYRSGPLSIIGSFSKSEIMVHGRKAVQYDGMALIQAANFAIAGFGSYTAIEGQTSLFVFAILHAELGGPPCFRVNGLAAGFGYNRKLILPPIEEVGNFPLVRAALDAGYFGGSDPKNSIGRAMEKLRQYIPPSGGEYWFAIGIRFNSFEMLQSFALLSVSFGQEVEIGLLGLSMMSLPRGVTPGSEIAYAELAIRAVINLTEGSIQVEGRLTDESYVFSKDCRITGGFAFYTWLSGPHAGDFVVTLGGYHPTFRRPAHYPIVPRLGVNWQVSPELAIKAELYFALTPSCLMAGGRLSAVYESGVIRAWFIAYADFLLSWKPFYYLVEMGVSLGVEVDLSLFSIKAHLSVQLQLWGPEFGGQIDVDLTILSFTVRFGPEKTLPAALTAEQFVKSFLPEQKAEALTTSLAGGLLRQEKDGDKELRVANGHAVVVMVQSLIPVTTFDGLAPKIRPTAATRIGVKPMGKTHLESKLTVNISKVQNDRANLRVELVETGVPEALWGPAVNEGRVPLPAKPEAKTILAGAGLRISFAPIHPQGALPAMDIAKFAYEPFDKPIPWDDRLKAALPLKAGEVGGESIATMMSPTTKAKRNAVLEVLARQSPFELNPVDLTKLVEARESYFQEDPKPGRLGSLNESSLN